MELNKDLSTVESALKIMGKENVITIDEALSVFPNKRRNLTNYDTIPYCQSLLYTLSEKENPFILFPAFPKCEGVALTITNLRDITNALGYDFFEPFSADVREKKPGFVSRVIPEPRWYLISKEVMTVRVMKILCGETDYTPEDFQTAPAVVYTYAWTLFKLIKKRTLYLEDHVHTGDKYADRFRAGAVYVNFKTGRIGLGNWLTERENMEHASIVPSVKPFTK